MNVYDDLSLTYRVAKLYFAQCMTQSDIAKMVGISRPQVSRLLKYAEEIGIVEIKINFPQNATLENLKANLKIKYDLADAEIFQSSSISVENVAAEYLKKYLKPFKHIGLGWGETMYKIALNLSYSKNVNDKWFYPLAGSIGNFAPQYQGNNIVDRFGERFEGNAYFINNTVFEHIEELDKVNKYRYIKLEEKWNELDCMIMSVGGIPNTSTLAYNEMLKYGVESEFKDIIGDVLCHFFNKDGNLCKLTDNINSVSIDTIKNNKNVCVIAVGELKTNILKKCLDDKLINVLITDDITARLLMEI